MSPHISYGNVEAEVKSDVGVELTVLIGGFQLFLDNTDENRSIIIELLSERNRFIGSGESPKLYVAPDVHGRVIVESTKEMLPNGFKPILTSSHLAHFRIRK